MAVVIPQSKIDEVVQGVEQVWKQIAQDVLPTVTNEEAVECCLYADRLSYFDQPEAYLMYRYFRTIHSYPQVLTLISKHCKLV